MSVSRPGTRSGFSASHSATTSSAGGGGPDLAAERVAHAPQELDVGAVDLAGPLADPQHVRRAVVPVPGQGVLAGERLLVAEDERLVAGVEVDLVQARLAGRVDAARGHEPQRPVDVVGHPVVAPALGARRHELLVPLVDPGQVGETALGEGAEQVQGGRRLVVGLHQPVGVGDPGRLGGHDVVDHVAPERRQLDPLDGLGGGRAGLGELAGDAPDLQHGDAGRVRQHDRHLEDDLELVADAVGRERVERLGAVTRLQQERLAVGHLGEVGGQVAGLAREHQRGQRPQVLERPVERTLVGPRRLLGGGLVAPRVGRPGSGHAAPSWPSRAQQGQSDSRSP